MYDAMTEPFRGEVAQFVESARKNLSAPGSYYGTLTRVRSIEKELAISETVVEYLIMTQRVEETGDASRTYYQEIAVQMVKEAGIWKIHQVHWIPITNPS